MHIVGNEIH